MLDYCDLSFLGYLNEAGLSVLNTRDAFSPVIPFLFFFLFYCVDCIYFPNYLYIFVIRCKPTTFKYKVVKIDKYFLKMFSD